MIPDPLEIATIHAAYRDGSLTPLALINTLLDRIDSYPDKAVFISRTAPQKVSDMRTTSCLSQEEVAILGDETVQCRNVDEVAWVDLRAGPERSECRGVLS